jgi:hypothetical protein
MYRWDGMDETLMADGIGIRLSCTLYIMLLSIRAASHHALQEKQTKKSLIVKVMFLGDRAYGRSI